ncbi:MAG: hypothetical protein LUB59_05190, partial [Candidatus Gastranaerophilales bacterium]|nr:hypothetical protein [Candidatus Gastranaerophilales bacterium]
GEIYVVKKIKYKFNNVITYKNALNVRKEFSMITEKQFSREMVNDTLRYQKKYNFGTSEGKEATHNNESDAFKHAYMQAYLTCRHNAPIAAAFGWGHEILGNLNGQPNAEYQMDIRNNEIGREIGLEVKKELEKQNLSPKTDINEMKDIIAEKVFNNIKSGRLITSPNDERAQKNNSAKDKFVPKDDDKNIYTRDKNGVFNVGISEDVFLDDNIENNTESNTRELINKYFPLLERGFPAQDRVFYDGEYSKVTDIDNQELTNEFLNQYYDAGGKLPSVDELENKRSAGELIYVNDYVRKDGTKVSGYYRHCPDN